MNLKSKLQHNVQKNINLKTKNVEKRQKYIENHYILLQAHVTKILIDYSTTTIIPNCFIHIGKLYHGEFGDQFLDNAPEGKSLPTNDELMTLTVKLEQFLQSEGIDVKYDDGYILVNWE